MHARDKCWPQDMWSAPTQTTNTSDFKMLIQHKLPYIDKSLFIQFIIENNFQRNYCINYPIKSGKSINLSMLKYFFGDRNSGTLFKDLEISKYKNHEIHQGKYKVFYLDLAVFKDQSDDELSETLKRVIKELYLEHYYIIDDGEEGIDEIAYADCSISKQTFLSIINDTASTSDYESAFKYLIEAVYFDRKVKHKERFSEPIILIDNVDVETLSRNNNMLLASFFRLKDNQTYSKLIVVGDKKTHHLLSHRLNGCRSLDVTCERANKFFGCSDEEMKEILQSNNISETPKPDFHYQKYYSYESEDQIPPHGIKEYESKFCSRYYLEAPAFLPKTVLEWLEKHHLNNENTTTKRLNN